MYIHCTCWYLYIHEMYVCAHVKCAHVLTDHFTPPAPAGSFHVGLSVRDLKPNVSSCNSFLLFLCLFHQFQFRFLHPSFGHLVLASNVFLPIQFFHQQTMGKLDRRREFFKINGAPTVAVKVPGLSRFPPRSISTGQLHCTS